MKKQLFSLLLISVSIFSYSQDINSLILETKAKFNNEKNIKLKSKLSADLSWYYAQIEIDSSLHYGEIALQLAKKSKDETLIAQALNDLATATFVKGNYTKSLEYCNQSLKIRQKNKDEKGVASLYFKKGNAFNKQGKYDSTMYYYTKSHKYYEKVNDSAVFINLESNIGSTYFLMGNHKKALKYFEKAISYYKKQKDFFQLSNTTLNLGNVQLALKDTTGAINSYNKTIEYALQANNLSTLASGYNNIGSIYTAQNKFDLAVKSIEQSISIREKLGLDADLESSKLSLANNQLKIGDFSGAKRRYLNVKKVFEKIIAKEKLKDIYLGLSYIYAAEKNKDSLNFYQKKYNEILSSIYKSETLKASQEIEVKYQTEKKEREILLQKAKLAEKNTIIISIISLLLLSILIGYIFYNSQKNKTIQLKKENELKDALLKIETQNRLQEQRLEISRDLHDNIGAQLTFIISSIDSLKYAFAENNTILESKLNKISAFTKETIYELRDTIWAMNKEEITIEDLKTRISNFIENAQISQNGINFSFKFNCSLDKSFSSKAGMNIYRITQEAINNAIKHAKASQIYVSFEENNDKIILEIVDNGTGFSMEKIEIGNGLNSIKKRAFDLKGELKIESLEQGTKIKVTF